MKWRKVKSYLLSHGIKALAGNERFLREEIDELAKRYEAGTVSTVGTAAKVIPYFRCTDIVAELEEFVREKAIARLLTRRIGVTNDALRVTVLIDKGGGYTKAFITVWDVENGMSPTNAVFLGMYEGKDDHDAVFAVFGDALRALETAAAGINWPYQYGDEKAVTNDQSVKAFFNHPAVKRDRARTYSGWAARGAVPMNAAKALTPTCIRLQTLRLANNSFPSRICRVTASGAVH